MGMISFPISDDSFECPVSYGDIFYSIESIDRKVFNAKCPSCGDERKIHYKGVDGQDFEADCPVCKTNGMWGNSIVLRDYVIYDYIVYKISLVGPESKGAYGKGKIPPIQMNLFDMTAFHKTGNSYSDICTIHVPMWQSSWNNIPKDLDDKRYFTKKKDAENLRQMLIERDKKLLAEFNKKYGTDFEYPF